jgi:putative ABC transport system permease protein
MPVCGRPGGKSSGAPETGGTSVVKPLTTGRGLIQDLAYAIRRLRRSPVFVLVAVLTLGCGIGLSAAVFGLVDAVLLRPLPVREADRLVVITPFRPSAPTDQAAYTLADYRELRAATHALVDVTPIDLNGAFPQPVGQPGNAELVNSAWVGATFARVVGVTPIVGRGFDSSTGHIGAAPEVMISYRYWRRAYAGSREVVGKPLIVFGQAKQIVGVMPRGFDFPRGTDIWVPMPDTLSGEVAGLVGRLTPGATAAAARAELDALVSGPHSPDPPELRGQRARTVSITDAVVGSARPIMFALAGAVALLLLMTGVNVAALVLARARAREHEATLRVALGAGRARARGGLLWECVVLAGLGAIVGTGLATATLRALIVAAPPELPRLDSAAIDARVLAYTCGVAALLAIGLGAACAAAPGSLGLTSMLRDARVTSAAQRWPRRLVVSQVAMAVVVLAGAGLTLRTVHALTHVDMGFASDRLLIGRVYPAAGHWESDSTWRRMLARVIDAIDSTPGVVQASPLVAPPFTGRMGFDIGYLIEDQPATALATNPLVALFTATPATFETLGIPVVRGRGFTTADRAGGQPVAVVSEDLARTVWPGRDAIGQRIRFGATDPWQTVVGVVRETRFRDIQSVRPTIYLADAQAGIMSYVLGIRAKGRPDALVATIRRVVSAVEPRLGLSGLVSTAALAAPVLAPSRFAALLLSAVAGTALLLAGAGLYGTLAALVEERRREIGIRLALGALPRSVALLVVRQGIILVLAGAAIGCGAALAGTRYLATLLYGVTAGDPITYAGVLVTLALIAVVACALPAYRAGGVDPMVVIRDS